MDKQHLLNHEIKSKRVLLLDKNGEKLGEMTLQEALHRADQEELDLMQLNENNGVAICKIINYESWLYHEKKRKQKQEFKNRSHDLKVMNFRPVTEVNDFNLKIKKIKQFLDSNHKVKVVIKLRSREGAMREFNEGVVNKILSNLNDKGSLDNKISWGFKEINFIVKPEKKSKKKDEVIESTEM